MATFNAILAEISFFIAYFKRQVSNGHMLLASFYLGNQSQILKKT